MASLRSSETNEASRMARLPGVSRAPPTPWRIRVTISWLDPAETRAGGRREGEPPDPDHEDPFPPIVIAERPTEEQQRRQGEGVAGHHPLQGAQRGVEVTPDGREGDADDGGVDGGHARAEHGGGDHPATGTRAIEERSAPWPVPGGVFERRGHARHSSTSPACAPARYHRRRPLGAQRVCCDVLSGSNAPIRR